MQPSPAITTYSFQWRPQSSTLIMLSGNGQLFHIQLVSAVNFCNFLKIHKFRHFKPPHLCFSRNYRSLKFWEQLTDFSYIFFPFKKIFWENVFNLLIYDLIAHCYFVDNKFQSWTKLTESLIKKSCYKNLFKSFRNSVFIKIDAESRFCPCFSSKPHSNWLDKNHKTVEASAI